MPGFEKSSLVQRSLTFATGLVECLCFAGAVFGWASLVFVLKTEGYFSSLCVNVTQVNGTALGQLCVLTYSMICKIQLNYFSLTTYFLFLFFFCYVSL